MDFLQLLDVIIRYLKRVCEGILFDRKILNDWPIHVLYSFESDIIKNNCSLFLFQENHDDINRVSCRTSVLGPPHKCSSTCVHRVAGIRDIIYHIKINTYIYTHKNQDENMNTP